MLSKKWSMRLSIALVLLTIAAALPFNPATYAQDGAACEEGYRLYSHALGDTCIPVSPQRVVVLDTGELDNALALNAPIVGAPVADALAYQGYLNGQLDGITDTGAISTPNLEVILELAPDLILGSKQRHEAIYEQLSAIAPTVFVESLRVPWQSNFAIHADALGKTIEAEALLAAYDAQIADLQALLGDELDTTTISIIRFRPGQVRLYLKSSYIGYILQDIGLPRPESQDEDVFSAEISIEEMQLADADYIFVTGYDVEDSERETFLTSPLWQTLSAVQNGRVLDVNDDHWIAGLGVQAAQLVLADLIDIFSPYPISIEHKFGTITLDQAPTRVVSLGFTEQDFWLAFDVAPIAARYWYGNENSVVFPWAEDEAAGREIEVLRMDYGALNYEAIAALRPDFISAIDAGITQEEYDILSQLAPTLAAPAEYLDFGTPWQVTTRLVGTALGKADEAEAIIAHVEGLFASAREENPAFEGQTIAVAYQYGAADTYGYYTDQDVRGRFFSQLGFVIPQELIDIAGEQFYAYVSSERLDLLDQDLIVFLGLQFAANGREGIESDPLISSLPVMRDGQVVFVPAAYDDALQFSTVLSLEYALEGVLPELQAVVSGD